MIFYKNNMRLTFRHQLKKIYASASYEPPKRQTVNNLNKLFYKDSVLMSGDELSGCIKNKFGKYYKADIIERNNIKFLCLVNDNEPPDIPDAKHFNILAEEINKSGNPESIRHLILNIDIEIKDGNYVMEIPI